MAHSARKKKQRRRAPKPPPSQSPQESRKPLTPVKVCVNAPPAWISVLGDKFYPKILLAISPILVAALETLEENEDAIKTEGIFRVPGSGKKAREVIEMITKKGKNRSVVEVVRNLDISDVPTYTLCTIIVIHMREQEPLLTHKYHDEWLKISDMRNEALRVFKMKELLYRLPPSNIIHCYLLIHFVRLILSEKEKNKMGIDNLSTIFSPLLISPPDSAEGLGVLKEIFRTGKLFKTFVTNYADIFGEEAENLNHKIRKHKKTPSFGESRDKTIIPMIGRNRSKVMTSTSRINLKALGVVLPEDEEEKGDNDEKECEKGDSEDQASETSVSEGGEGKANKKTKEPALFAKLGTIF